MFVRVVAVVSDCSEVGVVGVGMLNEFRERRLCVVGVGVWIEGVTARDGEPLGMLFVLRR